MKNTDIHVMVLRGVKDFEHLGKFYKVDYFHRGKIDSYELKDVTYTFENGTLRFENALCNDDKIVALPGWIILNYKGKEKVFVSQVHYKGINVREDVYR